MSESKPEPTLEEIRATVRAQVRLLQTACERQTARDLEDQKGSYLVKHDMSFIRDLEAAAWRDVARLLGLI